MFSLRKKLNVFSHLKTNFQKCSEIEFGCLVLVMSSPMSPVVCIFHFQEKFIFNKKSGSEMFMIYSPFGKTILLMYIRYWIILAVTFNHIHDRNRTATQASLSGCFNRYIYQ